MKSNLRIFFFISLIGIAGIFSGFLKVSSQPQTPQDVLLSPAPGEKNPVIRKVLTVDAAAMERAKIEYLLARIRRSPCTFIRNGEAYGGSRAAMHITWKYRKALKQIKTADDFIEEVASRSRVTGEDYLVKFSDGRLFPMEGVLGNELRLLNNYLHSTKTSKN